MRTFNANEEAEVLAQLNDLGISFAPQRALRVNISADSTIVCTTQEEIERLTAQGRKADWWFKVAIVTVVIEVVTVAMALAWRLQ